MVTNTITNKKLCFRYEKNLREKLCERNLKSKAHSIETGKRDASKICKLYTNNKKKKLHLQSPDCTGTKP